MTSMRLDVARLRELEAKATPGPWFVKSVTPGGTMSRTRHSVCLSDGDGIPVEDYGLEALANLTLTTEMRNAIRPLLERLEEAEQLLRECLPTGSDDASAARRQSVSAFLAKDGDS